MKGSKDSSEWSLQQDCRHFLGGGRWVDAGNLVQDRWVLSVPRYGSMNMAMNFTYEDSDAIYWNNGTSLKQGFARCPYI